MTRESVEKYKIPVSVGVAVIVILSCLGFAYKVGAETERIKKSVAINTEHISDNKANNEMCGETIGMMRLKLNSLENNQEHIIDSLRDIKQDIKELHAED